LLVIPAPLLADASLFKAVIDAFVGRYRAQPSCLPRPAPVLSAMHAHKLLDLPLVCLLPAAWD
jgi:hypothetical protein